MRSRGHVLAATATAFLAVATLGAALPARALTVDAATVKVRNTGAGTFRLRGRFAGISFDGVSEVVLTLDRVFLRLPLAEFMRRRGILTYRGASGPARVARLRIDTRRRRFLVDADGWVLSGLGLLPLVVQARAGGARVVSPGMSLAVANAPTDADLDAVSETGAPVARAWNAAAAQYGNSLPARMETLRVGRHVRGCPRPPGKFSLASIPCGFL